MSLQQNKLSRFEMTAGLLALIIIVVVAVALYDAGGGQLAGSLAAIFRIKSEQNKLELPAPSSEPVPPSQPPPATPSEEGITFLLGEDPPQPGGDYSWPAIHPTLPRAYDNFAGKSIDYISKVCDHSSAVERGLQLMCYSIYLDRNPGTSEQIAGHLLQQPPYSGWTSEEKSRFMLELPLDKYTW